MSVHLPHSKAARLLAALAVAFTFSLADSASKPVSADATQWTRNQSTWSNSNGWHRQWRNQWHHRNQFGSRSQVIIGGGSGIIITGPGFIVGNPGVIVRQPGFIVGQPGVIVRRPNFIWQRPHFVWKQKQFFRRHPSLHAGKPWWDKHGHWKHNKHWTHNKHWRQNNWRGNGMRFTTPGMRFTTPGMRFTTP